MDHERAFDQPESTSATDDSTARAETGGERGTVRTRECELPGCGTLFPVAGKKKYCTKEHANEAARRRTVLETLAVDVPLEELRGLRDQVLDQVGPDVTRLIGQLGGLLERFATLETGAVARIADAEQAATDAAARAETAAQAHAAADRRTAVAVAAAEQERIARIAADHARQAADDRAQASEEDRVRADATRDAAVLAATHADARADLAAEATLAATARAAEERTRADTLRADLDRERVERAAEVTRLGDEARAAAASVQERHDRVLRQLREQTDARIDELRARHTTEVDRIRAAAAAEVSTARAEVDRVAERYTEAVREVERERARGHVAQEQLLRQVRRTLGALLDTRDDDTTDHAEKTAAEQVQRLRDGVTTVLRGLDDLGDDSDGGDQR